MFKTRLKRDFLFTPLMLCASILCSAQAFAWHSSNTGNAGTAWNASSDPNALYGKCRSEGSGMRAKYNHIVDVGESLVDVLAITVLNCSAFSGGGSQKVSCPAGSPYAYCTRTGNDGLGNDITLGVTKLDARTDPNGVYTGCRDGARLQSKLGLITWAGGDPRLVKGIVTLACSMAKKHKATKPVPVACPAGPDPYGNYCLSTPNDGFGNAVTIGVIAAKEAGDPYGLYGECHIPLASEGIRPGFLAKASLVTRVGRSMATVRSIDMINCSAPGGFGGGFPNDLRSGSCATIEPGFLPPAIANRYEYCVWGTDEKGNGVVAGVNK